MEWWMFAFIAAVFSAVAAILEKKILTKEKVFLFCAIFALFNLFISVPFFFFVNFTILNFSGILVLLIKTILSAGAFLFVMFGIKNLELSSALPLLVLTPGLVAVFAFIFLGEALTLLEIFGLFLLIGGVYILQLKKTQKFFEPFVSLVKSKGYIFILIALFIFTVTSILDKAVLKNFGVPVNAFMGFQHLFLAIIFCLILIFSKQKYLLRQGFVNSGKWIFILSLVTIVYRYTQLFAVKNAPVALALAIKRTSVFFAVVFGGRLFRESNLIQKIIAVAIMTSGSIMVILG